jgi:hypothetical protein
MSNSTQARHRFNGSVVDWNNNGYYDIHYSEPSRDTNGSASESCSTNQDFASNGLNIFHMWNFPVKFSERLHLITHVTSDPRININFKTGPCSSWSVFFFLDYDTIGTAATPGLLCQPRLIMKMIVESLMECRLAGETEVLGENLPQRHFSPSQYPKWPPRFEPGQPLWEPGD